MAERRTYTRSYIAYVGKRIVGTGRTPQGAKRASPADARKVAQTAFASRALVEMVQAGRKPRFTIARNGRATTG